MNKMQMAHEMALELVKIKPSLSAWQIADRCFEYADAMQAEADKREDKARPEVLEEWQPDWSQAPAWAGYFAMDEDGEFYYFEKSPTMASCSWQPQSQGEVDETFNHSYKGNWKNSLRKRPQ